MQQEEPDAGLMFLTPLYRLSRKSKRIRNAALILSVFGTLGSIATVIYVWFFLIPGMWRSEVVALSLPSVLSIIKVIFVGFIPLLFLVPFSELTGRIVNLYIEDQETAV